MSDQPTTTEQAEFLRKLGLSPDAASLAEPARVTPSTSGPSIPLAPEGVDPHTMDVTAIVFDERLLDGFGDLEGENMAAASRHVFALYKSKGRDKDRNSLLHRRVSEFIGSVRRARKTGGHVKEAVKSTREQRDLAAVLAAKGLTTADLIALLEQA